MRRSRRLVPALVLVVGLVPAACAQERPVDERVLHSVMLGTDEVIDGAASDAVDRIGLRLRALGPSYGAVVDAGAGAEAVAALDRLDEDVAALADAVDTAPAVVRDGFTPYVTGWSEVAAARRAAVATDDPAVRADALADADAAVARLQELDARRIERVVFAFGEAEAERLLAQEGNRTADEG